MSILDRLLPGVTRLAYGLRVREQGQGLAEYAMILALVVILCVATLSTIKTPIIGSLTSMAAAL